MNSKSQRLHRAPAFSMTNLAGTNERNPQLRVSEDIARRMLDKLLHLCQKLEQCENQVESTGTGKADHDESESQYKESYQRIKQLKHFALSRKVRSGWHDYDAAEMVREYQINLATGGPGWVRVIGMMHELQPLDARIEYSDYGARWVSLLLMDSKGSIDEAAHAAMAKYLLIFAQLFNWEKK